MTYQDNLMNRVNIEGAPREQAEAGKTWLVLGLYASGSGEGVRIKVEGLPPMTPDEFAKWLASACVKPEHPARPLTRNPKGVWVAERASKEELAKMTRWREEWNKARRKYPSKTKAELDSLVREKIAGQERFQANWKEALEANLEALLEEI